MPPIERTLPFSDWETLTALQRDTRRVLEEVVPPGPVALLDFPSHQNAGDSLIWRGQVRYLAEIGREIRYVADAWRYSPQDLERHHPDGPILMAGGGNYGDLWPVFHEFRERVVRAHQTRRIVQLPQAVWFTEPSAAARTNDLMGSHPDYVLLVRESASLGRARLQLPDVDSRFCPDMALGLGHQDRPKEAKGSVSLLRRDKESAASEYDPASREWGLHGWRATAWHVARGSIQAGLRRSDSMDPLVLRGYALMEHLNVSAARALIGRAEIVVTDRLHAHVLACLMGIPNVVVDNSYGKIGAVIDEYTGRFGTVRRASSLADARAVAA